MSTARKEQWKDIIYNGIDYTGLYKISNMGRIMSFQRWPKGRILNPSVNKRGYVCMRLRHNGNIFNVKLHRLVANAFIRPLDGSEEIHHEYEKWDNRVSSLKIMTKRENMSIERTIRSGLPVGVWQDKRTKRYVAEIKNSYTKIHLGCYTEVEHAAMAYQIMKEEIIKVGVFGREYAKVIVNKYRASIGLRPVR